MAPAMTDRHVEASAPPEIPVMPARPLPLFLLAVLTAVPVTSPIEAQGARFDTIAVRGLVRLAAPRIAPDGNTIAVLVTRADYDSNTFRTELETVRTSDGARAAVVRGLRGVGQPQWSPSGDRLAFVATIDGIRQVHVVAATGGAPRQATRSLTDVQQFAWRPDGSAIAYIAQDPPAVRPLVPNAPPSFEPGNDDYRVTAPAVPSHLWVASIDGGPATRLTSGAWSLATALSTSGISWSGDARMIAVTRFASPSAGDTDRGAATLVDARDGTLRALTARRVMESGTMLSPDGRRVAYAFPRDSVPSNLDDIVVAPATGGAGRSIIRALDRQVSIVQWWPDGSALLLGGTDGTRGALWLQPLEGAARKLALGDIAAVAGASVSTNGRIALVGSEAMRPAELYVMDSPTSAPRRLTDLNAPVARLALGRSERLTWPTHDGMTADGVVTYPPDWTPAARRPLVLLIHGGPTASSTEGFSSLAQLLAARGWVVLQPNYRGSDNLGNRFQSAIADDAGEGPGRDVMGGIAALVARGVADSSRMAITGWSYGGFMTAWLMGRYPDRWRAAVAGAAPVDLTDMYALTDLNVMRRHAITSSPFTGDNLARYMAQSPIIHLSKARAPTLVMSMTADVRVVVMGSYKIFRALQDNEVPVQFIAFPGGGHSPPDPVRQLERDRRWVDWVAQWIEGVRP